MARRDIMVLYLGMLLWEGRRSEARRGVIPVAKRVMVAFVLFFHPFFLLLLSQQLSLCPTSQVAEKHQSHEKLIITVYYHEKRRL